MAFCIMYNIRSRFNKDTMCVPLMKFYDSFDELYNSIGDVKKFMEKYKNNDGISSGDTNIGTVIFNQGKKIIDVSFSQNLGIEKNKVNEIANKFINENFKVSITFPKTLF